MIVGKRMSSPIITVPPSMPLNDAVTLMKKEKIRHMVVADKNKMVGLVTQNDLENALPSKATSLSVWELNYLIDRIKVSDVMVKDVITATEDMPVEEAARLMADHKISCLPVLRGEDVVGIITETDLFRLFLELLGAREYGVRLSALLKNEPGAIARLTQAIYEAGGDIIAIGTFTGESLSTVEITIKVRGLEEQKLKEVVEPVVLQLLNLYTS
ncbi:MAG: CBS domain-containing protein [Chloroflexi bacterium]|jgi:acetoin utilization protein AcuB|nr:CBS domain-containing protein [Anaerolineaceae bacterium]NLI44989.1 CBS domain-containing protein [Chloroflexota bacterium]HOE35099.1 CBS and ACT domain-containing protein [Anaerolineaceae bacterium]HOT24821.1 CBS and ACT domain-containing protein [Anaerolineaceae bacterium]HQH57590.1 CBS and ACT domain-containing protein [Anaerolineaceae bacterium]